MFREKDSFFPDQGHCLQMSSPTQTHVLRWKDFKDDKYVNQERTMCRVQDLVTL